MHIKFHVARFQYKSDICHRSLEFAFELFLPGHLPVQFTWWFLAYDDSEIQTSEEDFRSINLNFTSNIGHILSCESFFLNINVTIEYSTKDPKFLKSQIT